MRTQTKIALAIAMIALAMAGALTLFFESGTEADAVVDENKIGYGSSDDLQVIYWEKDVESEPNSILFLNPSTYSADLLNLYVDGKLIGVKFQMIQPRMVAFSGTLASGNHTVRIYDGAKYDISCTVNVGHQPTVTMQSSMSMGKDGAATPSYTITPSDAILISPFRWSSSNTNVATVDEKTGLVKALAGGSATITLKYIVLRHEDKAGGVEIYEEEVSEQCKVSVYTSVKVTFDANGGSVSPSSGTYTIGNQYGSLPMPSRSGYTFTGWFTAKVGGLQRISTYTVTDTNDHTLYAHWIASGGGGGSSSGGSGSGSGGSSGGGSSVVPTPGGGGGGRVVTVAIGATEGGTVDKTSDRVVAGSSISANGNVLSISTTKITATASDGYQFVGWSGIPESGKVDSNISVVAQFKSESAPVQQTHKVLLSTDGHGTVSADVSEALAGVMVHLAVDADANYRLSTWESNVNIVDNSFIMPNTDASIKAVFERIVDNQNVEETGVEVVYDETGTKVTSKTMIGSDGSKTISVTTEKILEDGSKQASVEETAVSADGSYTKIKSDSEIRSGPEGTTITRASSTSEIRDQSDNLIETRNIESTGTERMTEEGVFTVTESVTRITDSEGTLTSVIESTIAETINPDGSVSEAKDIITKDAGGNVLSVSHIEESSSIVKVEDGFTETLKESKETVRDADGKLIGSTESSISIVESRASLDTAEKSTQATISKMDSQGNVTTIRESVNSVRDSDGMMNVRNIETINPDGSQSTVVDINAQSSDGLYRTTIDDLGSGRYDVTTTVGTNENAELTEEFVKKALAQQGKVSEALSDVSKDQNKVLDVDSGNDASKVSVSKGSMKELNDSSSSLRLSSTGGSITFGNDVLTNLSKIDEVSLSISKADEDSMTEAQKQVIGDVATAYDLKAMSEDVSIGDRFGGKVLVSVNHEPAEGMNPVGYYVDDEGQKQKVEEQWFEDGIMNMLVEHFSLYAVFDESPSPGPEPPPTPEPEGDDGNQMTMILIVAAVVIVIVAVGAFVFLRRN